MKNLAKSTALAATAAAGFLLAAPNAFSAPVDAWNFNASVLNGLVLSDADIIGGATDLQNLDHINVVGRSTINQTLAGFSPVNQPFIESGVLQLNTGTPEGLGATSAVNFGNGLVGYIAFSGLTGTFNADNTITFTPGSGSISLWVDNDGDLDPSTGGVLKLADYELLFGGGSDLNFFGGVAPNGTVNVTTKITWAIDDQLFTTAGGDSLTTLALHLVNTDSLLDPNFSPNPDASGVDAQGNGISIAHVQNNGQYNITQVPEPTTVFLLGSGLAFLGMRARKQK